MAINPGPSDPTYVKVDSLVRDGTLTPAQASTVYERMRSGTEGSTSVTTAEPRQRRWTLPLRAVGGAALLGAATLLGALLVARELADTVDFNWKAFLVLLIGALALIAVGVAAALRGSEPEHRRWLASGLVATGILAGALALDVPLRNQDWANYLIGAFLVLAGAAAYFWLRGSALTVVVVLGGLVVLVQLIDDIGDDDADSPLGPGIALMIYGLAVIAAGWRLSSRHVTDMLGGSLALLGMLLVTFLGGFFFGLDFSAAPPDINGDIWTALILGLLVCAALAALYAISDFVGYLVLLFVGAASLVASGLTALDTDNRLWLAGIVGAVGGLLVAGAVLRELLSGRTGGGGHAAYESPPGQYPPAPQYPPSPPPYPPQSGAPPYGGAPPA
jgi:MFS family permease